MNLLLLIQIVHTLIAVWNYFCLIYIIYAHLRSSSGLLLRVCYITIIIEAVAIIPLGLTCPLRLVVDQYFSPQHEDILIPAPYSQWIMPVGIALFLIGQAIRLLRQFQVKQATDTTLRATRSTRG